MNPFLTLKKINTENYFDKEQNLCFLRSGCSSGKFIKLAYVGTMQKLAYDLGAWLVKNQT